MNSLKNNVFMRYSKAIVLLVAAFGLGMIIATGIAQLLETGKQKVVENKPDPAGTRDVFVLKSPLREGKEITPEDVLVVQQPKDSVPRGAVKTYQQIEGRSAKSELPKGTLLLDEFFVARTAKNNAQGFIPPGFHAVPVQVHEPVTDGKTNISAVLPGDQVDIIVVQKDADTGDESGEFVLLEKIPVLDAVWEEIGESQKTENKGTVSLLLSDAQRKNLQEESQEETKIRLRICPPVETQTAGDSQPQSRMEGPDPYSSTNSANRQPELISHSLAVSSQPAEITVVFHDKAPAQHGNAGVPVSQALRPVSQNEVQFLALRGIPAEEYAADKTVMSQVSAIDKMMSDNKLVENKPSPRYSSFYDTSGRNGNADMKWQVVAPRPPVVYEARPETQNPSRGVYRAGGAYISAQ